MQSSLFAPGFEIAEDLVVVQPLKQGGMGAVYVVEQKSTGKLRALKVMHREIVESRSLQRRFEQEARVGARIQSEHVVEVLGTGVEPTTGLPYILMELLEGDDLGDYAEARGPLARDEVCAIFEQLCHGIAAAHAAGVVHRDLKPENVFVARSRRAGAGAFTIKVLDFGIAKLAAELTTSTTTGALGSPIWMAPEQTAPGPVTPATDVWALGLIAYRLLTGENFWRSVSVSERQPNTAELLREIVLDPIPRASVRAAGQGTADRLPQGFDEWFARSVAREPHERFSNAAALWKAMRGLFEPDAFARTEFAPGASLSPPKSPSKTGVATPFDAERDPPRNGGSTSRTARSNEPPPPTPMATVQPAGRLARASSARALVIAGVAIGLGGIGIGWALARGAARKGRPAPHNAASVRVAGPVPSARAPAGSSARAPAGSSVVASASSAPVAPRPPRAKRAVRSQFSGHASPGNAATHSAAAKPRGVLWTVGDHRHVSLLAHLVSNESNVADSVVKSAVEYEAWEYLLCYRPLAGLKVLPGGTVIIGFDIVNQLPQHARLQSSSVPNASFNQCVLRTLLSQTINAAGPSGAGHVVYAFHFVPVD